MGRDDLLAKAVEYYAANGVRDTSLRTLASAIGTSQRMLHYHFGAREDLLAAVVDALAAQDARNLDDLFAREADPFAAGRENWRRVAANAEVVGALYFELAAHAMHGRPYAAPIRAAVPQRVEAAFAAAYRAGNADVPAAALARLTVAVGHGLLFAMLLDGDRAASEAALDLFTSMVRELDEASRTDAPPPS